MDHNLAFDVRLTPAEQQTFIQEIKELVSRTFPLVKWYNPDEHGYKEFYTINHGMYQRGEPPQRTQRELDSTRYMLDGDHTHEWLWFHDILYEVWPGGTEAIIVKMGPERPPGVPKQLPVHDEQSRVAGESQ